MTYNALKYVAFSFILIIVSKHSMSQNFYVKSDTVIAESSTAFLAELVYNYIYNTTSDTLTLNWIKTKNEIPKGWYTSVCDEYICYDSTVIDSSFIIKPYDSTYLVGHFVYAANTGTGLLDLIVYDPNDSAKSSKTLTYILSVIKTTSVEQNLHTQEFLYPNPSNGTFKFNTTISTGSLVIYNSVGKQIFEQKLDEKRGDIIVLPSSISNGLYFIEVTNQELKFTKKIIIQR